MSIKITGTLTAADAPARRLSYRLLTFGEVGNTSAGLLAAEPGSITVPADLSSLTVNEEHQPTRPLGRFVSVEETPEYIDAEVEIVKTSAGDDALELAASGLRRGISVELSNIVTRGGRLLAGTLTGAGLVVKPAYPSSVLTASDQGDLPGDGEAAPTDPDTTDDTTEKETHTVDPETSTPPAGDTLTASGLESILSRLATTRTPPARSAYSEWLDKLTAASTGNDPALTAAALDTVAQPDVYDVAGVPQYLGELWSGKRYRQRYAPLLSRGTLTGRKMSGWRFKAGKTPIFDDWNPAFETPNAEGGASTYSMTDIPTNPVEAEEVEFDLKRGAGGNRIDRIYKDFPAREFWDAYWREATDDYARWEDRTALTELKSAATSYTATGSDNSSNWSRLILGAAIVMEYGAPDFAIVGNDIWRDFAGTTELERLAFLNAGLGLTEEDGKLDRFKIVGAPYSDADMNGKIIVGVQSGTSLYTLPGAPIRVEAEVVQKGATDHGLFGYAAVFNHDTRALAEIKAGV